MRDTGCCFLLNETFYVEINFIDYLSNFLEEIMPEQFDDGWQTKIEDENKLGHDTDR